MANLRLTSNFAIWILLLSSLIGVRCHPVLDSTVQQDTNEGSDNEETPADFRHKELLEALRAVGSVFSNSVDKMATGLTSRLHELDKSIGLILGELKEGRINSLPPTMALIQADAELKIKPKGSEGTGNSIYDFLEISAKFFDSLVNETEKAFKMEEDFYERDSSRYHCPEGWESFGGSCYFFSLTYANWEEGRQECLRMNGDYAKITTMEEWNFIANNIKGNSWIGLNDIEEEGTFKWVSDDSLYGDRDITWWHGLQPDNHKGKEDCVLYWFFSGNILWNDSNCDMRRGFICEMAPTDSST